MSVVGMLCVVVALGIAPPISDAAESADTIYMNGTIVTVDPEESTAEAVAVKDGKILLYAAAGVTTAHEGATHAAELDVLKRAAAGGATIIDVIAFPFITELEPILEK
jgi:predicted amidohydrolase YtcJ